MAETISAKWSDEDYGDEQMEEALNQAMRAAALGEDPEEDLTEIYLIGSSLHANESAVFGLLGCYFEMLEGMANEPLVSQSEPAGRLRLRRRLRSSHCTPKHPRRQGL